MSPPVTSDEAAFWAAIEAAPGDDAPWLVYADWLQERDRDREAAAIRRFLPAIQAHLSAGRDAAAVRDLIARQDPDGFGWDSAPAPAPPPIIEPPDPATAGGTGGAGPGDGGGAGVWLAAVVIIKVVVLAGLGLLRSREDRPPPPKLVLPEEQLKWSRVTKDGKEYIAFPIRSRPPTDRWHPAELPGHTLRLAYTRRLVAVVFDAGGRARTIEWDHPGIGFPRAIGVRWAVDPAGVLVLTGPSGEDVRVQKLHGSGDWYQLDWGGQTRVYSRVSSGAPGGRD